MATSRKRVARKKRAPRKIAPLAEVSHGQTTRKIVDIRNTRDLKELLPSDAADFTDDLLDVISRMPVGYWPTIKILAGWYPLLADLNKELDALSRNYEVLYVRKENGALYYEIRLPLQDQDNAVKATSLITAARGRSRCICEICGKPGSEIILSHEICIRCHSHGSTPQRLPLPVGNGVDVA